MKLFQLTEDHIKLLSRMYVDWDNGAYDGASINIKRPYGNSSVAYDVYEIIHSKEWDYGENDEEMPEEIYEQMLELHLETRTALQIVLCTKSFEPGLYELKSLWDSLSWRKVE
jgi:hypothetical protein